MQVFYDKVYNIKKLDPADNVSFQLHIESTVAVHKIRKCNNSAYSVATTWHAFLVYSHKDLREI